MYMHILFKIVYVYLVISYLEWFIHKYIMHGDETRLCKYPVVGKQLASIARGHQNHHKTVRMDMHFRSPEELNTYKWWVTNIFTLVLYILTVPLFWKHKYTYLLFVYALVIFLTFCQTRCTTTFITPKVICRSTKEYRIYTSEWWKNNFVYKSLYLNHAMHHLQKGPYKYNHNIVIPGMDYLLGTKMRGNVYNNEEYCNNTEDIRCTDPNHPIHRGTFKI